MTPKYVVSWMPEAPPWKHAFEVNELTGPKHCWNVSRWWFYANFLLMSHDLRTERFLWVRPEILGLCFNRLTIHHMYSRLNREIFLQLVRTQLSQKPEIFFAIFIGFLKSTWIFEHFERKDELHHLNISEVVDTEECGFLNARKLLLQNTVLKWRS